MKLEEIVILMKEMLKITSCLGYGYTCQKWHAMGAKTSFKTFLKNVARPVQNLVKFGQMGPIS